MKLDRPFFERRTETVGRALLGCTLVSVVRGARRAGIIVETEAYLGPEDQAAHTFNGRRTERTEPMWAGAGTAYVYFTYGMHYCMNLSTRGEGIPQAVLIRAIEPTEGLEAMSRARKTLRDVDLCNGPAKLCAALAINGELTGHDTIGSERLWVEHGTKPKSIGVSARIGLGAAGDWTERPLRFFVRGNAHVSKGKPSVRKAPAAN